jgi:hypothetical protein
VLRRLLASFVSCLCLVSVQAAADEANERREKVALKDKQVAQPDTETPATQEEGNPAPPTAAPAEEPPPLPPPPHHKWYEEWDTEVHGYFRAPLALGVSSRPNPDNPTGPSHTQISYGPNRTIDASAFSFSYTRLQEQDWAETFIHEKHKHVDAAVGWMGYWFQAAGFRNLDAAWVPGLAYLKLDTDFRIDRYRPNVALQMGAWWPGFGYFAKYDTFTLGRFRQLGEQVTLTWPFTPDLTARVIEGFGTGRDGSFQVLAPPFYGATVGADLIGWVHGEISYKDYVDVGLHYNTMWTADPNLTQQTTMGSGKSYTDASQAHLTVAGVEANVNAPYAGHFWVSPSIISVRNGWALGAGTEVMHSLGGIGIATNYMGFTNSTSDSTGSGTMLNFGFLYENSLSVIRGHKMGTLLPDLTFGFFALATDAALSLPSGSTLPANGLRTNHIKQFKYGLDATIQATSWLAFMMRYDFVNMYSDAPGYVYAIITPRIIVSSHFLSGETIYFQYSRYFYGDRITLNPTWPWNASLVAGESVLQEGPYSGKRPDEDVFRLQATIAF